MIQSIRDLSSGFLPAEFLCSSDIAFTDLTQRHLLQLGGILINTGSNRAGRVFGVKAVVDDLSGQIFNPANLTSLEFINPWDFQSLDHFRALLEQSKKKAFYTYQGIVSEQVAALIQNGSLRELVSLSAIKPEKRNRKIEVAQNFNFSALVIPYANEEIFSITPLFP